MQSKHSSTVDLSPSSFATDGRSTEFSVAPERLRVEHETNPVGIDSRQPRLSWLLVSKRRGTMQTAYQVRVSADVEALRRGARLIWDSGKIVSDDSIHVRYAGPAVQSRQRYHWQVRIWDELGRASSWSEPAYWEMGLLNASDWLARWISPSIDGDREKPTPPAFLRSTFHLRGKVRRARAYITSLGAYELHLNGRRVGDALLTPGWTSFDKRLQYQSYEVEMLLAEGANAVGVTLGDGWYRRMPFNRNRHQINGRS